MKRGFRQAVVLIGVAIVIGGLNGLLNPATPPWSPVALGPGEVNLEMVRARDGGVLWVDARSGAEFAEDHIPGAVLLNEDRFDERLPGLLEAWDGEAAFVVYCDSRRCGASAEVARRLREDLGLPEVYVLKEGWRGWVEARDR